MASSGFNKRLYSPVGITKINVDYSKSYLDKLWVHTASQSIIPIHNNIQHSRRSPTKDSSIQGDYLLSAQNLRPINLAPLLLARPANCLLKETYRVPPTADNLCGLSKGTTEGEDQAITKSCQPPSKSMDDKTTDIASTHFCDSGKHPTECNDSNSNVPKLVRRTRSTGGNNTSINARVARQRLQQLMNVSEFLTDADFEGNKEIAPSVPSSKRKKSRKLKPSSSSTTTAQQSVNGSGSCGNTSSTSSHSFYMDRREAMIKQMKAAAQQCQEQIDEDDLMRCPNWHVLSRGKQRKWVVGSMPVTSRIPPHRCKVKAKPPKCIKPPRYGDDLALTEVNMSHSEGNPWVSILKRRDHKHRISTSATSLRPGKHSKQAGSRTLFRGNISKTGDSPRDNRSKKIQAETCDTTKLPEKVKQIPQSSDEDNDDEFKHQNGKEKSNSQAEVGISKEDDETSPNSHILTTTPNDTNLIGDRDTHSKQLSSRTDTQNSLHRDIKAYYNRRRQQSQERDDEMQCRNRLNSPRNISRYESPPEIFYQPYPRTALRRAPQNLTTTLVEAPVCKVSVQPPVESKDNVNDDVTKTTKTSTVFWKSLVGEEEKAKKAEPTSDECYTEDDYFYGDGWPQLTHRSDQVSRVKPHETVTRVMKPNKNQTVGSKEIQEAAPTEVTNACQGKGYEILRKLTRGKFRENVYLYLANNEENPDFSPVEITAIRLPSRSLARSFLDASIPEGLYRRKQTTKRTSDLAGFTSSMMPAHENLLLRLHVFMSGNWVYQVCSHCQWPPLSHLLESATVTYCACKSKSKRTFSSSHKFTSEGDLLQNANGKMVYQERWNADSGRASDMLTRSPAVNTDSTSQTRLICNMCKYPVAARGKHSTGKSKHEVLQESSRKKIFKQICAGLSHLHEHSILHGDLNCSNVLVTDKRQVKLAGYGPFCLHTPWESPEGESCNPPLADPYDVYIPPEIMSRRSYRGWAKSSDMWCLGMTLLHMTLGEVSQQVNSAVRLHKSKQFKILCLSQMSYQTGLLLESLLQVRPPDRPSINDITTHNWFSDGTDLASDISKVTETHDQLSMRTDGRSFPLPKRIRQAFSNKKNNFHRENHLDETDLSTAYDRKDFTERWINDNDSDNDNGHGCGDDVGNFYRH